MNVKYTSELAGVTGSWDTTEGVRLHRSPFPASIFEKKIKVRSNDGQHAATVGQPH
jgi:hypothetical protein